MYSIYLQLQPCWQMASLGLAAVEGRHTLEAEAVTRHLYTGPPQTGEGPPQTPALADQPSQTDADWTWAHRQV